jgi:hypothetical protein
MLVADVGVSDVMRDLAGEFGVDFDRKRTRVIDHFSYEPALDDRCGRRKRGLQATACMASASSCSQAGGAKKEAVQVIDLLLSVDVCPFLLQHDAHDDCHVRGAQERQGTSPLCHIFLTSVPPRH